MKKFDKINGYNIIKSDINDIFIDRRSNTNVILTYKSCEKNFIFAQFKEINKDGSVSKFGFVFTDNLMCGGAKFGRRNRL